MRAQHLLFLTAGLFTLLSGGTPASKTIISKDILSRNAFSPQDNTSNEDLDFGAHRLRADQQFRAYVSFIRSSLRKGDSRAARYSSRGSRVLRVNKYPKDFDSSLLVMGFTSDEAKEHWQYFLAPIRQWEQGEPSVKQILATTVLIYDSQVSGNDMFTASAQQGNLGQLIEKSYRGTIRSVGLVLSKATFEIYTAPAHVQLSPGADVGRNSEWWLEVYAELQKSKVFIDIDGPLGQDDRDRYDF